MDAHRHSQSYRTTPPASAIPMDDETPQEKTVAAQHRENVDCGLWGAVPGGVPVCFEKDGATEFPAEMMKYWCQRYRLFSRFDEGILIDNEGWFSVTPECIARHVARRCAGCGVLVDGFCGVGGNAIQFALTCNHVIAIDIDPHKLALAKHNSRVYGVEDKIDFIHGDFLQVASSLRGKNIDAVFLSAPWGGPGYNSVHEFDLNNMSPNGFSVFHKARELCPNIAFYLPRNTSLRQLLLLGEEECEVEQNFINGKNKAITVYFGDLKHP